MKLLLTLLAVLVLTGNAIAASCPVVEVKNDGAYLNFGVFKGHLISDSDPDNSTAWEGPLIIKNAAGKSCNAELSIISPPFFLAGTHYLYVTTYSGSESIQSLIDANNCEEIWFSPQFTGYPSLHHGDTFTYRDAKPVHIKDDCRPAAK